MLKLLQYCNYIIIVMQIKLMLLLLLLLRDCPQNLTFAVEAKCLFFGPSLSRGDYLTISRLLFQYNYIDDYSRK